MPFDGYALAAFSAGVADQAAVARSIRARVVEIERCPRLPPPGLSDEKLVEAQMFYSDTAAVLRFLERAGRARPQVRSEPGYAWM